MPTSARHHRSPVVATVRNLLSSPLHGIGLGTTPSDIATMSAPGIASSKSDTAPRAKPQRVLACVLCQQRKIKCDRKFPCSHCTKHQLQCVPATQNRPRRRRFPERELLDRLRKYEGLLRQNKVDFEPLHGDLGARYGKSVDDSGGSDDEHRSEGVGMPSPSVTVKSETSYEPK